MGTCSSFLCQFHSLMCLIIALVKIYFKKSNDICTTIWWQFIANEYLYNHLIFKKSKIFSYRRALDVYTECISPSLCLRGWLLGWIHSVDPWYLLTWHQCAEPSTSEVLHRWIVNKRQTYRPLLQICYWSVVWFELEGILDLGDLREIFEILDEKWGNEVFCLSLKLHVAWVNLCGIS